MEYSGIDAPQVHALLIYIADPGRPTWAGWMINQNQKKKTRMKPTRDIVPMVG